MYHAFMTFISPLLHPGSRLRRQCLVLLTTLVVALLYLGSRPNISVIFPYLPWDKLVHATAYAGFASLAWVGLGGGSLTGPVVVAGVIGLLDEGMQYYSPGRTADIRDLVADLVGATIIVLVLKWLQAAEERRRLVPRVFTAISGKKNL